jgi:hypothetical protein
MTRSNRALLTLPQELTLVYMDEIADDVEMAADDEGMYGEDEYMSYAYDSFYDEDEGDFYDEPEYTGFPNFDDDFSDFDGEEF